MIQTLLILPTFHILRYKATYVHDVSGDWLPNIPYTVKCKH